ncbi:agarase [Alteromonas stellipolaris]|uniref:beta-galactosidase n=1 Tax=Alteromonas stellipolaris TaxID=233316 RepID=UPI000770271D|nr:beta-galactosidase [Alteromonas stellipolaris]AMJ93379.1 agarase [Alteromonas stellipolaris]ANB26027.1 agarase [Alteromonas stellipolaris]
MNKTAIALALSLSLLGCQKSEEAPTFTASKSDSIEASASLSKEQPLIQLTKEVIDSQVELVNAKASFTSRGMKVTLLAKDNPNSGINIKPSEPWDLSEFDDFNLAMDIENPGPHSVQLFLNITDIDGATYTRSVAVPVGEKATYYAKMRGHDLATPDGDVNQELNFLSGLRSNPETWESGDVQFISMWGKKNLNLKGITEISLSVQSALFDKHIELSNIRLRPNPEMNTDFLTKIVDKYGQNATVEFPGKIHSQAELIQARETEAKQLDNKLMPDRSRFGGYKEGPKLAATGYFRTEKIDGKWAMVDPEGYLYFATGLDIIRLSNTSTMTGYGFDDGLVDLGGDGVTPEDSKGLNRVNDEAIPSRHIVSDVRANMFNWLPSYDEPLGKWFGYRGSAHSGPVKKGETFSFYASNLERKYGEQDPLEAWEQVTLKRMKNWGFSSLGNWTDPRFYQNNEVPYFANGWIIGDFKTVSSGNDFWSPLPDVFDPEFARRADVTASNVAEQVKNSPWCVGVFIDNEKSFGRSESNEARYGIVINTLTRDGKDVPTKAAFTGLMKKKYGSISALNAAWGTKIASWGAFNAGIDSSIRNEVQLADYSEMLFHYGEKYFSVVNAALDKHMPNHMYLGARFPSWGKPMEIVEAAAKHVDVMSYNVYKEGIHPKSWEFLQDIDMPSIIGEFHMGARDNGLFHPGLIQAATQEDRAQMYIDYMHSVIDNPYFVGAHWFQYMDSPITGRAYDGENYNVGFVNVADTPYAPMIKAAKEVNSKMYPRRFK